MSKQGKRFINVDETWINQKDFRRKSWRRYNQSNSIGVKAVAPRITFMIAFDTEGDVFYSLTQVNTDRHSKRMML